LNRNIIVRNCIPLTKLSHITNAMSVLPCAVNGKFMQAIGDIKIKTKFLPYGMLFLDVVTLI
jgi:hypothetical protein